MATPEKESHSVETLHGLTVTENKVIITVTSTGCTDESDFEIVVRESLPPLVSFVRIQADFCKMAPHSVDLSFSLKKIGTAEFKVENLFSPGPRRLNPPITTTAIGEENPPVTTLAIGEEVTTLAIGEENPPTMTTKAIGEEENPFGSF